MRTRALATIVVALFLVPSASAAGMYHGKPCVKLYSLKQGKRANRHVYRGRRHVSRRESAMLDKISLCQHGRRQRLIMHRFRSRMAADWRMRRRLTDFVISGRTSTFGPPTEGGTGAYGSLSQPCIATRYVGLRRRHFMLTILGRSTPVVMCDYGPAGWTGKAIDVTGAALENLGISPYGYDNYPGVARLMR